jgi:hypothetical protein
LSADPSVVISQIPLVLKGLTAGAIDGSLHTEIQTPWVTSFSSPSPDEKVKLLEFVKSQASSRAELLPINSAVTYREADEPLFWLQFIGESLSEAAK